VISLKFHFHHDKQVKISLLGEYQPRRCEEITAREVLTQFLIFENYSVEFLFFLTLPNYGGKLNIYELNTPFLDEVWFRPLYIKISCLDQSYFSSSGVD